MCLGLVTDPKRYEPLFTLSRALSHSLPCSLSLTSPPFSLSPRPQDFPFQVDSKAKGTSIGVGNHLLQVFHLGAVSFLSFSCKGSFLKVPKLGLSGLIVLGCVKRFPLGQSSSYESLY